MLLLTRRPGEEIFIGKNNEITVTVAEVRGNQVRIGITADKDVPILRKEVFIRELCQEVKEALDSV
jgi:carbon storage regulator